MELLVIDQLFSPRTVKVFPIYCHHEQSLKNILGHMRMLFPGVG